MLVLTVNSEKEYLDLIADLSKYGVHVPNQFATLDKDGMAPSDLFKLLPPEVSEEYLGVRDYKYNVTKWIDKDGTEWEDIPGYGNGPLNRESLHFCPELIREYDLLTPKEEDYPILIMWFWEDNYDRIGLLKSRYFTWVSMSKILNSSKDGITIAKAFREQWNQKFAKLFEEKDDKQIT